MRKTLPVLFALLLAAGTAHAAPAAKAGSGISLDGTLNYATEPESGFDDGWGFDVGLNVDLKRLGMNVSTSKGTEVQGRVSLGYYEWDEDFFGNNLTYERIPLFVGGRVLWTASPAIKVFGQLGLEISFDEVEVFIPGLGTVSDSDTNLGLVPGVGVLFPIGDIFYLGGALNFHIISDSYFTLGIIAGFNLP